jgi:hypothetical protein
MVADLRRMMTATDARTDDARDSIYHVPVVTPSSIALVSDEHTCRKALRALERFETASPAGPMIASAPITTASPKATTRQVVVASLGRGWAVEDPGPPPSRFLTVVIFDAQWKQVGGYTGP